ncbi:MAG: hypothetical protein ACNS63_12410 [Candidatus Nitrospinota bacterium M3_3B_026]
MTRGGEHGAAAPEGRIRHFVTSRHILALSIIAVLVVAEFASVLYVVGIVNVNAAVMNISGRQRMLCTRIGLLAHDLIHEAAGIEEHRGGMPNLREKLIETADLMEYSMSKLFSGSEELNLPGDPSETVRRMLLEKPMRLMERVAEYTEAARRFSKAPVEELTHANPAMRLMERERDSLMRDLDALVGQYQREAELRKSVPIYIILISLALTMAAMVFIASFIFLPMAREIQRREELMVMTQEVALAASEASSPETALRAAIDRICEHTGFDVGHIHVAEPPVGGGGG